MKFVKAEHVDRRELVVEQILNFIRERKLEPGLQLAPEHELAKSFGVSRTVVREAMQSLQATGAIRIQQGRGTFVAENPFAQPFIVLANMNRHRMGEVYDVRAILESESAFYAATKRSTAQLNEMNQEIENAQRHLEERDWSASVQDDISFHRIVTRATGFSLLQEMLEVAIPVWLSMNANFSEEADKSRRLEAGIVEHQAIFDAIKAGDAIGARAAMTRHIQMSKQRKFFYVAQGGAGHQ